VYSLLKPLLFLLNPEKAHHITVRLLKTAHKIGFARSILRGLYTVKHHSLERKIMGLTFKNPVGLAAGFDKNGELVEEFESLGFGFIEIGTVTPKSQPGNAKPRLFRLPKDEALINRMGFNNDGVESMVNQLKQTNHNKIIIGGNIGKNKLTPNTNAVSDYTACFNSLFPYVDYFAVNVSSPNTPNLRALQQKEPLQNLLNELQHINHQQKQPKPILLKVAPDLSEEQLSDIVEIILATNLTGVIATNTTISRDNLITPKKQIDSYGPGGLSGKILNNRSLNVIKLLRTQLGPEKVIIGVGGIDSAQTAKKLIEAGADLIQIYSGLVYKGPSLVKRINKELLSS